tara:strand:- start:235 stop:396 length:162 start_codon:yes stop_codon:yes gene_type:complete
MSEVAWWWEIKVGLFSLRQKIFEGPWLIGLLRPGPGSRSIILQLIFAASITGK